MDVRTRFRISFDSYEWDVLTKAMKQVNCEDLRIFAKEAILKRATLIAEELK